MEKGNYNGRLSFKEALYNCYANPSFKGRARRSEFWWNTLFYNACSIIIAIAVSFLSKQDAVVWIILEFLLYFSFLIMSYFWMTVSFRRLHDIGRSGWWVGIFYASTVLWRLSDKSVLFGFINMALFFIVIVAFGTMDSLKEKNKYGKSPKYDLTYKADEDQKRKSIKNVLLPSVGCTGCLMSIVISIGFGCLIASLICDINPEKTYSWYSGIWHGVFFIPNLIRHFFDSAILYKANFYTTAYNVWWWIVVSGIALGVIGGGSNSN